MPSTVSPSGVQTVPGGQKPFWQESMQRRLLAEQAPERHWRPSVQDMPLRPSPAGTQTFAARPVRERMAALQPKPAGHPDVGVQRSRQIDGEPGSGIAQIPERQVSSLVHGLPSACSPPVAGGTHTEKPRPTGSLQVGAVPRMRGQSAIEAHCPVHQVPAPPQTPREVAHSVALVAQLRLVHAQTFSEVVSPAIEYTQP